MALKVLNYFDKIVVEIKFLESSVFLKPGNFIYFVERKDQSLQVDEAL